MKKLNLSAKIIAAIVFFILGAHLARAAELTIFDVRKTLPLTNDEPVFQDFYINGGKEEGLKPGMIITVTRRVSLYDTYQNKSPGELKVAVGNLKVIHVQNGLSVARLYSLVSRANVPILDYNYIMVGDQLDMKSATMDRGKSKVSQSTFEKPSPETLKIIETPASPQAEGMEPSEASLSSLTAQPESEIKDLVVDQPL